MSSKSKAAVAGKGYHRRQGQGNIHQRDEDMSRGEKQDQEGQGNLGAEKGNNAMWRQYNLGAGRVTGARSG